MFSKQDILSALEPIIDTSLLVEMGDNNYQIDTVLIAVLDTFSFIL